MVNTPKLDIGGACHGINNQVMCVFYLSGGAGSQHRERDAELQEIIHETCRAHLIGLYKLILI
jgi:hypothetical protein